MIGENKMIESVISTANDDVLNELLDLIDNKKSENKIKYGLKFAHSNNWTPLEISFNEVDEYDFTKGFNEFLIREKQVHLYFDFDSIKTTKQFDEVYEWLEKVSEVFGEFSIGGYCNNKEMEEYGFRYIENDKHYLSMHVVFYETCINSAELMEIMRFTEKKGYYKHKVHSLCDPNVYKLKTRQVFRHALSDKIFTEKSEQNRETHGFILDDLKPSTQIVQIKGNEPVITKNQWIKIFPEIISKTAQLKIDREERKKNKGIKNTKIDDIDFEDELIIFNDDEMDEFLNHFDPEFDNLLTKLAPLRYSPYSKEFLYNHLVKWYGSKEHTNGVENVVEQILNYYKKEKSNKWFFSLLKHLPEEVSKEYKAKYSAIDFTININNSTWSFENIRRKQYSINGFHKLINDLRGVIGFVEDRWYLKTMKESQYYIKESNDDKIAKKLKGYKPFKGNNTILR